MYKVINIGAGDVDRFISIIDEDENEMEVFDYSASTIIDTSKAFRLLLGEKYNMKLKLFGEVVGKGDKNVYGNKLDFQIIKKEVIGCIEMYSIKTRLGIFFIKIDDASRQIDATESKRGFFDYSRIDLLQVDEKVHPEFL